MTTTTPAIIKCPVCQSQGDLLHHDIRACLVYSCSNCLHEWEIDPADVAVDDGVEVKRELKHRRGQPDAPCERTLAFCVSDKLTEHQIAAKVKQYFDR
jgi:hypothetical protein